MEETREGSEDHRRTRTEPIVLAGSQRGIWTEVGRMDTVKRVEVESAAAGKMIPRCLCWTSRDGPYGLLFSRPSLRAPSGVLTLLLLLLLCPFYT